MMFSILGILQGTLTQYAPNYHPREYTQAAYYLPFDNEEYSWTKSSRIENHKKHRRRKKYNDDSISAQMDYGPKRLQCKCTCKRKYDTKHDYEENDPCCNCYSKSDAGDNNHIPTQYPNEENNGIYRPTQYPDVENNEVYRPVQYPNEENNAIYRPTQYPDVENNGVYSPIQYPNDEHNGIYRPTQYPNGENNGIYMPTQFPSPSYPSLIYPTFDRSLIEKIFPWLTTQATKTDNDRQTDKDTASKEERDKYSTSSDKDKSSRSDDKDRPSPRDDRDKYSTSDDKGRSSASDDKARSSISDDKDRSSKKDDRDKPSISDDKDGPITIDDRNKAGTRDETSTLSTRDGGDKSGTKDYEVRSSQKDDKDNPLTRDDRGIQESVSNESGNSYIKLTQEITDRKERHSTIEPTLSTYPYVQSEHFKKLFHSLPKKKKCLRDKCVRKDYKNKKIGRYYKDDLVERPTIASYLNVNRRRNNVPRKLNEVKPYYGIIPNPDKLAMKFMNELRN